MQNVTLSFPDISEMAYFIIECGISDFEPDWKNASMSGDIRDCYVSKAFGEYNAYVVERKTTVATEDRH